MIKFRQKDFAKVKLNPTRIKRLVKTAPRRFRKKADMVALNPGRTASDAVGFALENPVGATVIGTGYALAPGIPGTSAAGLLLDGASKKIPGLNTVTKGAKKIYVKSGLGKVVEKVVNSGVNIAKNTPGIGY